MYKTIRAACEELEKSIMTTLEQEFFKLGVTGLKLTHAICNDSNKLISEHPVVREAYNSIKYLETKFEIILKEFQNCQKKFEKSIHFLSQKKPSVTKILDSSSIDKLTKLQTFNTKKISVLQVFQDQQDEGLVFSLLDGSIHSHFRGTHNIIPDIHTGYPESICYKYSSQLDKQLLLVSGQHNEILIYTREVDELILGKTIKTLSRVRSINLSDFQSQTFILAGMGQQSDFVIDIYQLKILNVVQKIKIHQNLLTLMSTYKNFSFSADQSGMCYFYQIHPFSLVKELRKNQPAVDMTDNFILLSSDNKIHLYNYQMDLIKTFPAGIRQISKCLFLTTKVIAVVASKGLYLFDLVSCSYIDKVLLPFHISTVYFENKLNLGGKQGDIIQYELEFDQ